MEFIKKNFKILTIIALIIFSVANIFSIESIQAPVDLAGLEEIQLDGDITETKEPEVKIVNEDATETRAVWSRNLRK